MTKPRTEPAHPIVLDRRDWILLGTLGLI
ncbi:MAG: hypothetical protein FD129_2050, partial [bacterium]